MTHQATTVGATPKSKNIIICSDGTGNSANKRRGTNVFKLFEAIDISGHLDRDDRRRQIAFYDDGVGTQRFAPLRLLGGAMGWGLARNVRQLYRELSRAYDPGDRIYLFGFSRGAFTVRTLVSLICRCGLIDVKKPKTITYLPFLEAGSEYWLRWVAWRAWRAHRWHYRALLEMIFSYSIDGKQETKKFRETYSLDRGDEALLPPIHFVGVWDTVGAVAIPFNRLRVFLDNIVYRFSFPSKKLPDQVEKACHAIAIDEERHAFQPVLWDETGTDTVGDCRCDCAFGDSQTGATAKQRERAKEPRIEQVWFPGVHSSVGGGYPKQGISLVALDWMMAKTEDHGLRFGELARQEIRENRNAHDHLYNSRRGVSLLYFYKPRDLAHLITKTLKDKEREDFPGSWFGWFDWKIHAMRANQQTRVTLRVHASAFDRIEVGTQRYTPAPIPGSLTVVKTPRETRENLDTIRKKITQRKAEAPNLSRHIRTRQAAQWAFYSVVAIAVVVALVRLGGLRQLFDALWERNSEPLSIVIDAAIGAPFLAGIFAVILVVIWVVSRLTRARLRDKCRKYWHRTLS